MHRLWQVDDHYRWLELSERTVARAEGWSFEGFLHPEDALAAYAAGAPRPTVILMDYFLGGTYGDAATEAIRTVDEVVVIVGHSSVPSCSERIVLAGGNLSLPKHTGPNGINPDLLAYLDRW